METYMHSAWNSWPQGRLMTRLTPSMYSSKHTTHSRWRRPYRLRHSASPDGRFSSICWRGCDVDALACADEDGRTSEMVRDRGRDRVLIGRVECSSGVEAVAGEEMEDVVELVVVLGMV